MQVISCLIREQDSISLPMSKRFYGLVGKGSLGRVFNAMTQKNVCSVWLIPPYNIFCYSFTRLNGIWSRKFEQVYNKGAHNPVDIKWQQFCPFKVPKIHFWPLDLHWGGPWTEGWSRFPAGGLCFVYILTWFSLFHTAKTFICHVLNWELQSSVMIVTFLPKTCSDS